MSSITIEPLAAGQFEHWLPLARGYKSFYATPTSEAEFVHAFARLVSGHDVYGFGAWREGQMVAIAHYLYHTSVWLPSVCYLQDLFVHPEQRGQRVADALIARVRTAATEMGARRFYWLTKEDNDVARRAYDRIARYHGFIRYDCVIDSSMP
jgi:GNAT superfamily N-acetyltransferase